MRRGLMGWDRSELPQAALEARLARLQAAMARDGLDALSALHQSGAAERGVLAHRLHALLDREPAAGAAATGTPVLATALSKRVADWIRTTAWLDEIVNTPKPGTAIGQRLADAGCKRVGVLELDALPAGLYDDIVAAAPSVELVDASAIFAGCAPHDRRCRAQADRARRRARGRGARSGRCGARPMRARSRAWSRSTRGLPARRRPISRSRPISMPTAGSSGSRDRCRSRGRFAVRASVAYKGAWVRRTRSFARDPQGAKAMASADAWLPEAMHALRELLPSRSYSTIAASFALLRAEQHAQMNSWMAESCIGSYPLEVVATLPVHGKEGPAPSTFLVLSVDLAVDDVPWLGAAPFFVRE